MKIMTGSTKSATGEERFKSSSRELLGIDLGEQLYLTKAIHQTIDQFQYEGMVIPDESRIDIFSRKVGAKALRINKVGLKIARNNETASEDATISIVTANKQDSVIYSAAQFDTWRALYPNDAGTVSHDRGPIATLTNSQLIHDLNYQFESKDVFESLINSTDNPYPSNHDVIETLYSHLMRLGSVGTRKDTFRAGDIKDVTKRHAIQIDGQPRRLESGFFSGTDAKLEYTKRGQRLLYRLSVAALYKYNSDVDMTKIYSYEFSEPSDKKTPATGLVTIGSTQEVEPALLDTYAELDSTDSLALDALHAGLNKIRAKHNFDDYKTQLVA
jgi:hypothetical protein